MTETTNTNEQSGATGNPAGNPSSTGSTPRILVNTSARKDVSTAPGSTGSHAPVGAATSEAMPGSGTLTSEAVSTPAPAASGSMPPVVPAMPDTLEQPAMPMSPADMPPTQLYAAPGAVKSAMPDWAQNAVTGNIRETAQGQARRKAHRGDHANHAAPSQDAPTYEPPAYDAPRADQQAFPGYDSGRNSYTPSGMPYPSGAPVPQQPTPRKGVTVAPGIIIAICAVIIVLVVALVVVTLSALNSTPQPAPQTSTPVEEVDHRWDDLTWENGRAYFSENGQVTSQTGIDVSEHQGWIDWNAVSNDNIDFAYIRLGNRGYTEGVIFQDQYYEYNIDAAREAGLDLGVYFFSQAINEEEAREEAEFVLEKLGGRTLDLPIAWDHEVVADSNGRANNIDRETLTKCAQAFFEVIEAAGYDTILYGNTHDLERIDLEALGAEPVWLAEYDVDKPTPKLALTMWQYTNGATVSGVDGAVDLDIRFKNPVG